MVTSNTMSTSKGNRIFIIGAGFAGKAIARDILNNKSHVPDCHRVLLVADQKIMDQYGEASKFYIILGGLLKI